MIESSKYRKAEAILYSHYKKKKRISILICKLARINNRIQRLKEDIKECNVELRDTLKSIDYSKETVKSNRTKSSIEQELVRAIDNLIIDLEYEQRRKRKTEALIRDLKRKIDDIEIILEQLTEEELELIELKYSGNKSLRYIAEIMHCDSSTIKRRKDKLIEFIALELNL